jgi:photosystem II stability/assembly factor-like uncharacterized protein
MSRRLECPPIAYKGIRMVSREKEPAAAMAERELTLPRGPRKKAKAGPPAQRVNLNKARTKWFGARVTWPMREAPLRKLQAERARADKSLRAARGLAPWSLAGPTNIGGRCTSLVCDPADSDHLWIGSAGGGVWTSHDAGHNWQAQWPETAPLQIGSLSIDPSNPKTLYCGTGEANMSADSYPGDGIYRSVDGGGRWELWASSVKTGIPRRVGTIAVDPADPHHVLVGGVGLDKVSSERDFGGLYTTRDDGATWVRESFVSSGNYWCHKIVFDQKTPRRIFVTVTNQGLAGGIYRSNDGGATWTHLHVGLPRADRMGRTALAVAPSNPDVVYCICADAAGNDDRVLGVFRSADGGDTWTRVSHRYFLTEGQMSYGSALAVHPTDPNRVICGGVDLHATHDGGKTWAKVSHWDAERGKSTYAHADHHMLVMPADRPGRVFSANDGGMDLSEDMGRAWTNRSAGLAVTMYYDIDVAQGDVRVFGGGAQDNGTLITTTGRVDDAFELMGGDGGWMVIDPNDSGHIYASAYNCDIARVRNGKWIDASPKISQGEKESVWMVYITIDPNDSDRVFTGTKRMFRTDNDGVTWRALTPTLDGSPVTAIEVASANSSTVYVGTENGAFFRSLDGGDTWSANLAGAMPGVTITRIETHPTNADLVFVSLANFGNSHVFMSSDAGAKWTDIDRRKLPDVPHHAVLTRSDAPDEIWVSNDAGVFLSRNAGKSWQKATDNLPPAMVVDLVYHRTSKTLFAATYGRSIWKRQLA